MYQRNHRRRRIFDIETLLPSVYLQGCIHEPSNLHTHTRNIAGTGRPSETHPVHSDHTVLTRQLVCVGFGLVFFLFTPVERIILEPTARGLVYNLHHTTSKKNIYSTLRPASREVDLEQSRHSQATEKLDRGRDPRQPIRRARPIQTGGFIFQLIRALQSFRY